MTRAKDISKIVTDADLSGTLDVTGTVTAGGLTVESGIGNTALLGVSTDSGTEVLLADQVGGVSFKNVNGDIELRVNGAASTAASTRLAQKINENGDISFYEDTGTTAKFFWDASEERLGIGNSSPDVPLEVQMTQTGGAPATSGTTQTYGILRLQGTTFTSALDFGTNGGNYAWIQSTDQADLSTNYSLALNPNGGNVGIGTSSPNYQLQIQNTGDANLTVTSGTSSYAQILLGDSSNAALGRLRYDNTDNSFQIVVNGGVATNIDSSGNVGVGTISPSGKVGIVTTQNNAGLDVRDGNYFLQITPSSLGGMAIVTGNNPLISYIDNAERMRITSGGNVLVGTASGTGRLTIDGTGTGPTTVLKVNNTSSASFVHAQQNIAPNLASTNTVVNFVGKELSLKNSGYIGYTWSSAGSNGNRLTFGHYQSDYLMNLTADGKLGIGTTSPATKLAVSGSIAGTGALNISGGGWGIQPYVANSTVIDNNSGDTRFFAVGADNSTYGSYRFYSGTTSGATSERMRILADASNRTRVYITADDPAQNSYFTVSGNNNNHVMITTNDTSTTGGAVLRFKVNNTYVGQISCNASSTTYSTSSDHRLKENVTADWDATTRLKQLNPVRFNFIADADTTVDGFLAHEVQSVVPEAITGTHNEVDDDGNPVYQSIDQSKIVPLLVKTIQELEARIVALETA